MPRFDSALLRQEVDELTRLLRHDRGWADLRLALKAKGVEPDEAILAGFMEDEEGNEFGVIVERNLTVYEYEQDTHSRSRQFVKWRAVPNPSDLLDEFPAVEIGIEIARERR